MIIIVTKNKIHRHEFMFSTWDDVKAPWIKKNTNRRVRIY